MKERVIEKVDTKLDDLNVRIVDVKLEKENNIKYLRIVLDGDFVLDTDVVYKASEIISPLVDELDLIEDGYVLDIYAKEKGDLNE